MTAANPKRGFSLLEILAVLAILGILLGISGFLFSGVIQRQRLNEATRTFGESLRLVSETAITKSQTVTALIKSDGVTWQDEDSKVGSKSLPYGATLKAIAPDTFPLTVTFSGRGLPVEGHKFILELNNRARQVNLLPTGAVTYK
jgi:prepilin-type N-terminal cleavage/methylation domain-containing protein